MNAFVYETHTEKGSTYSLTKHWHGDFELQTRDSLYLAMKTPHKKVGIFPAPNLSEVLDRLPEGTSIDKDVEGYWCRINFMSSDTKNGECSDTAVNSAALMLLKLTKEEG